MKYSLDHVELLKKHTNSFEFKLTLHRQNERGTIIIKTNDSITQNKLIHKKFQIDLKKELQKLSGGSTDLGKLTFNLKEQLYVIDNNCFVYDIEGKPKEKAIVFKELPDSKRSVVGIYNTETFSLQLSVLDSDKLSDSGKQKCEEFFKTLLTSAQSTPTTQTQSIQTVLPTQRATLPVPTQTATAVPTTQLATPPTVQTPTVVLETMPFVDENGESQTENAEEELRGILTTVQRYLALIIGNRTSDFYIEDTKNFINEILEKNELTDKEKSTNLLPKLKNFLKDVIDTKDMKKMDPWDRYMTFKDMFNDVQKSIDPQVLDANDLQATLTTLFGKNPAVLKGYEEKAKRIGAATYKKSKVAYEHYLLKSREKETTQIKKINALEAYKKKIGDFVCDSNVEKNISSVEKIDYSTMKLILGSNILMLPEYPDIDTLNQDSPKFISATLGHYMNYLKLNSDVVQITLGASVTSEKSQGWFFMQNKNKSFKIFTNDCVLKGNNKLVDEKIEAGKSELMTIRNALSKEFDRVTGNIAIAEKTTAGNLMRSDEDLQRIDLMSQLFLNDDVLIMDPIICLMILHVFPKVKHKTYVLDGKCLYEGCSEQWKDNNNTKDYYMRNAVHFFELNYNVNMDDYGTQTFGNVQLEGEGDVRTMKYKIKWRGDLKTVNINVCPIPNTEWDDGLYRLCGPNGESVKDHYWDMPKQPTKPIVRTEDSKVYITPGEMDVLKKIKTYYNDKFVESINFKRNPLGYYDKNKNDGNLVWFPAQPNKEEKIQISKRKPSLTFRFVDVLDRESEMSNEITLPVIEQVEEEKEEVEEEEKKVEKEQEVEEEKKVEEASPPVDKYAKYLKMLKMGIPLPAVKQKMMNDGISTEEITKFENIKGGDIENVTLNLIVPIKDVITKEILMENVPTSTTITTLKEMILEKLKSESIMQEYSVSVDDRDGYNIQWNEFMISVSQWKEKINYKGDLFGREVDMNAELKKTYKRNDIVGIVGKGSEDFVNWILKNVPCVTIGNRHYTNLQALLQKTREETTGETKGETNEETNLMKEQLEKIDNAKIDKILNGTFKTYKDIGDKDTKKWLKKLIDLGLWKCDDPDSNNAKFKLEKIRDEARKYVKIGK
jgi:hypothetical protein